MSRSEEIIELLDLIAFAVGTDADNNNGKVDREAVRQIVQQIIEKVNA